MWKDFWSSTSTGISIQEYWYAKKGSDVLLQNVQRVSYGKIFLQQENLQWFSLSDKLSGHLAEVSLLIDKHHYVKKKDIVNSGFIKNELS